MTTRLLLNRLGILGSQCGQGYIECAVSAVQADRTLLTAVTGRLYPLVAQRLGTTSRAVGRGIGRSLECCWEAGDRALLEAVAGRRLKARPYPREFIAMLADFVAAWGQETPPSPPAGLGPQS